MSATPRTDALRPYIDTSYSEIPTDSGTGSRILVSEVLSRAVKLNEDRSYHSFIEYAASAVCEHLPRIFSHKVHENVCQFSGCWFTVTEMEKLQTLSRDEADRLMAWYTTLTGKAQASSDPFELLPTFQVLKDLALKTGHKLDLGKSNNYMVREAGDGKRVIVVIDPFN